MTILPTMAILLSALIWVLIRQPKPSRLVYRLTSKLIYYMKKILILFTAVCLFGCTKELEKVPQGQLTESNVFTQASDFLLATDAAYEPLTNRWRGSWDWSGGASISRDWVVGDVMSDDAVKGGGGLGDQED